MRLRLPSRSSPNCPQRARVPLLPGRLYRDGIGPAITGKERKEQKRGYKFMLGGCRRHGCAEGHWVPCQWQKSPSTKSTDPSSLRVRDFFERFFPARKLLVFSITPREKTKSHKLSGWQEGVLVVAKLQARSREMGSRQQQQSR